MENGDDLSSIVAVLTFIIQNYNVEPRPPLYVTYGIAQYVVRFLYEGKTELKRPRGNSTIGTGNSDELAYFFKYVNSKNITNMGFTGRELKEEEMNLIQLINWEAREGKFNKSTFWQQAFDKGEDTLWSEMVFSANANK